MSCAGIVGIFLLMMGVESAMDALGPLRFILLYMPLLLLCGALIIFGEAKRSRPALPRRTTPPVIYHIHILATGKGHVKMNYICNACGAVFDEPEHFVECLDRSIPYWEEWDGCPCCGESDYERID